ncbi:MAG: hypothetical protein A2017_17110 [Lentisphaerae bacterium GWF2_44_16]|nr:MAG: hypothetical protein A2017_17110 [Lentisphaerae bacterium GWF2_44_16]
MFEKLKAEAEAVGKKEWRAMLSYTAELHGKSVHPPLPPFPHSWEEIGPGYCYAPAFGHWDIIHAVFDSLVSETSHAKQQLINNLTAQEDDGLVPGVIWLKDGKTGWSKLWGHPPVWIYAADEIIKKEKDNSFLRYCFEALKRQIVWFENKRKAEENGFFYLDILEKKWESGIDEGIRFDNAQRGAFACVDATSHVYALYKMAEDWGSKLNVDIKRFKGKKEALADFIQNELFSEESGFFHDIWSVKNPELLVLAFEGVWPLVTGAATEAQAMRVIDENILNEKRFLTKHPLSTVAVCEPKFELRMWRGPAWNSMTFWAARGCLLYKRPDAAKLLLERALDASAAEFERSGTIWEFYHPHAGNPLDVKRKPQTAFNTPCRDYLGHNPLLAMARIYDGIK